MDTIYHARKSAIKLAGAALILLVILSFSANLAAAQNRKLRLGLAIPLSGQIAWLGKNTRRGIDLYALQDRSFRDDVELVYEDVGTGLAQGVAAVKKLVLIDKVDGLILELSNVINASLDVVEREKVPAIIITSDDSAEGRQYLIKLWASAEREADLVAEQMRAENLNKVAIVCSEHDSMLNRRRHLLKKLAAGQLVYDGTIGTLDELQTQTAKIIKSKPDAVVLYLMSGLAGPFARKLREQGYHGGFYTSVVGAEEGEVVLSGGALNGAIFADLKLDRLFLRRYRALYGGYPGTGVANGHDAVKMYHQASQSLGAQDRRQAINRLIRVRDFSGALGVYSFSFDRRNLYDLPLALRRIGEE